MKSLFAAVIFLLSIASSAALATGPSPKIAEAMNQPISYFRFGLLQLEKHIQGDVAAALGLQPGKRDQMAVVDYRYDDNRIDIKLLNFWRYGVTREGAAQYCASKLMELRRKAGVDDQGRISGRYSLFPAVMASQMGFVKNWEAAILQEYDRIMHVTVTVHWDVSSPPLACYGPLISNQVWARTDDGKTEPWLVQ